MLILGKNKKDYYDGVAGSTGIDKTIVYEREENELPDMEVPIFFVHQSHSWQKNRNSAFVNFRYYQLKKEYQKKYPMMNYFIIGFCGKLYVGWKLYYEKSIGIINELCIDYIYDENLILSMIDDKSSWRGKFFDNLNEIKNFDALNIFRKYHSPIFLFDCNYNVTNINLNRLYSHNNKNPKFIINPTLKDYEFYKIFDSFQAFQEIQMFLGGVLGSNEKNIVEVEDKYKIAQYGFDKWSFRKEPNKNN